MKIATFNTNSVRVRLPILLDWLATHQPDVLGLQEIKCEDHQFPLSDFEDIGYHAIVHGQKSYNGVALLSRAPLTQVHKGMLNPGLVDDRRIVMATLDDICIVNTYVPNGNKVGSEKWEYKMAWLENFVSLLEAARSRSKHVLWMGDINIAPAPADVYDSPKLLGQVGHHPDEFSRLARLVDLGFRDLFRQHHTEGGHYTYWDFFIKNAVQRKLGWRIDHLYATSALASRCTECWIDIEPRLAERPSDHTFVVASFE
ncbi:MAG: exodeoxyribonuclease III [Chthonomonas sp.]|nr:exodeoxyribonuclease III [Chthonomonas sp.]